jgi:tetratricopeptide (TPR) repeat protein
MRPVFAALVALALAFAALPTAAQPPPSGPGAAEEDRRTRLFKEGKTAADAGQWAEAAAKFREVVKIRSAPKALIALGVAEEKQGHLVAALAVYKQAREEAADKALTDELKTANAALESIRSRVPRLTFSPPDALTGARVELDGAEARPENGVLLADPGDHTVVATSSRGTFRTTVSLKEGAEREIAVVFGQAERISTQDPRPIAPPDKGAGAAPPTGAIVVAAAGLALGGAGAALYGVGSSEYAKSDELCPGPACSRDVLDRGNAARTQIIAGDILMIAGGVALAGGVVWWIVSATSSKKKPEAGTSLFIAPRLNGVGVGGKF